MTERTEVTTPRGNPAVVITREATSDLSLAGSMFHLWGRIDDEYELLTLRASGVLVDVGAHIGLVTLAVLLDNPGVRAICLEPIAENLDLLAQNMDANGVRDRVQLLQGAIGPGDTVSIGYGLPGTSPIYGERYIGGLKVATPENTRSADVAAFLLADLVDIAGGYIDVLKLDCEGCEWLALADPDAVARVGVIFGEWHGHPTKKRNAIAELRALLRATHKVDILREAGGMGTFRAVPR